jgi:hypothetical protein
MNGSVTRHVGRVITSLSIGELRPLAREWKRGGQMRTAMAAALAAMLVSGCGLSPSYRAAQESARQAEIGKRCEGYGFRPGTPAYSDCRMKVDLAEKQNQAIAATGDDGPTVCNKVGTATICN